MIDDLPKGFKAGAAAASFKKAGRDDLGLIVSDRPCVLAGMFTQNLFKAAPVLVCQEILGTCGTARAVLANSGQANACTGEEGLDNCRATQKMVAEAAGLTPREILPVSTGVVGAHLKMDLWRDAVPALVQSLGSRDAEGFTRAFMTTDAFPKFAMREVTLSGGTARLTVMAKGAGMICPNMATMLCVALTDADVERAPWQAMFGRAVDKTFNRVSVDGDTSTNDTILGLANGASGVAARSEADLALLEEALTAILGTVSHMLVMDGEGASKVIHITEPATTRTPNWWPAAWAIPSWSRRPSTAATPTGAALSRPWGTAARNLIPPRWACASAGWSASVWAVRSMTIRRKSWPSCSRPRMWTWRLTWAAAPAAIPSRPRIWDMSM